MSRAPHSGHSIKTSRGCHNGASSVCTTRMREPEEIGSAGQQDRSRERRRARPRIASDRTRRHRMRAAGSQAVLNRPLARYDVKRDVEGTPCDRTLRVLCHQHRTAVQKIEGDGAVVGTGVAGGGARIESLRQRLHLDVQPAVESDAPGSVSRRPRPNDRRRLRSGPGQGKRCLAITRIE